MTDTFVGEALKLILAMAGSGGLVALLLVPRQRRKITAESDSVIVGGAETAVKSIEASLRRANEEIEKLQKDRENDRRRIAALEAALHNAGIPLPVVA